MEMPQIWNARALCDALAATELFRQGEAQVELIEGAEPSLLVTMREFGDLPLFLAVHGEQILVEALLWPQSEVRDVARFNEETCSAASSFRSPASAWRRAQAASVATSCSAL